MKNKYYSVIRKNKNSIIEIHAIPVLYRYHSVTPYSVSALLQDELWGTVPTSFNDPYPRNRIMTPCFLFNHTKLTHSCFTKFRECFFTIHLSNHRISLNRFPTRHLFTPSKNSHFLSLILNC